MSTLGSGVPGNHFSFIFCFLGGKFFGRSDPGRKNALKYRVIQ